MFEERNAELEALKTLANQRQAKKEIIDVSLSVSTHR